MPTATPIVRPEANPFPDDLRQQALDLLNQVAAARGIQDPQPVDMFILTRDQARNFYSARGGGASVAVTPTPGPPPIDARQALYELLGLVPKAVQGSNTPTVQQSEQDNLISIAAAFYDPVYNAYYMIDSVAGGIYGATAKADIVHELTHALQYQTVDINAIAAQRAGNFDAFTALRAAMEGDAINSEMDNLGYAVRFTLRLPSCFEIPPPRNAGAPPAIERELDTLYEDGYCFVKAIAGQDQVAAQHLIENPPTTMEQIYHPDKYLAGEQAIPVAPKPLEEALGAGWQKLSNGTFGELGLQNILLTGLPDDRTRVQTAAAGWGGDAWDLYVSGDDRLLHLDTVWDTAADAPEFRDALVAALENRGFTSQVDGNTTTLSADGVTWAINLRDDSVTVLVSTNAGALSKAEQTLAFQ